MRRHCSISPALWVSFEDNCSSARQCCSQAASALGALVEAGSNLLIRLKAAFLKFDHDDGSPGILFAQALSQRLQFGRSPVAGFVRTLFKDRSHNVCVLVICRRHIVTPEKRSDK